MRSYINEARAWLSSALDCGANAPAPVRSKVLPRAGILAWFQSDFVQAQTWCTEGLALCRELGDTIGVSYALHGLGLVALAIVLLAAADALRDKINYPLVPAGAPTTRTRSTWLARASAMQPSPPRGARAGCRRWNKRLQSRRGRLRYNERVVSTKYCEGERKRR
jgi:hypothetical protein